MPSALGPSGSELRLLAAQPGSSGRVSGTTAQGRWGPLVSVALGTAALQHLGRLGAALGHGQLGSERPL